MTFTLRPYQRTAVERSLAELASLRSTLLVLPTGTGKTVVFCEMIKRFLAKGSRAMVLAHRGTLLEQAIEKLAASGVTDVGLEKAKHRANGESVIVASVQTLRGKRLERFPRDTFGFIVVDECHRTQAEGHRAILSHFETAKVLGVTATPDRLDGQPLGDWFDSVAFEYPLQQAIDEGYLVPIRSHRVKVKNLDLAAVRTTAGDFNQGDLAAVLVAEKNLHEIAAPLVELIGNRKTVVFAAGVPHTQALTEVINRYRPDSARALTGDDDDDDRRAALQAFRRGEFQVLVNCELLTEGWDEPAVSCVAVARPTKSRGLYAQMIGRGTRPHPGKDDLLVLDFVGNSGKHKLVGPADVLAGKDGTGQEQMDVNGATSISAEDLLGDQAARAHVTAVATFLSNEVDPFVSREPVVRDKPWAQRAATDRQIALLDRKGLTPPEGLSAGEASAIIDGIIRRERAGLCTLKQAQWLMRQGFTDANDFTYEHAKQLIDEQIRQRRGRKRRRA